MTDREHKIRQRAYDIWEEEGHPHGREQEHWHRAAREVESAPPAQPELPDFGTAPSLQTADAAPAAKPARKRAKAAAATTAKAPRKRTVKKS